mmetsp:Transcript_14062/g.58724  ORF Transcript_14062/g.58724 Transcript_14062/m.58724 type:complete len:226 (+) Transcript_14062:21-698(+)
MSSYIPQRNAAAPTYRPGNDVSVDLRARGCKGGAGRVQRVDSVAALAAVPTRLGFRVRWARGLLSVSATLPRVNKGGRLSVAPVAIRQCLGRLPRVGAQLAFGCWLLDIGAAIVGRDAREACGGAHLGGDTRDQEARVLRHAVDLLRVHLAEVPPLLLQLLERPPLEHDGLGVGRIIRLLEFLHGPVEPPHQEDAQSEAVRDQHQRDVGIPSRVHVADDVVLEDR